VTPLNWFISSVAMMMQLLPPLAVRPYWNRATLPRQLIVVWSLVFFVSDLLQIAVSRFQYNNHWVFVLVDPIEDAVILWTLSLWQTRAVARIALRVAIPLTVIIYLAIVVASNEVNTFKTFGTAFRSLVVFGIALFTLISRSAAEPEGVWDNDWLWVTLGVALYYGLLVATDAFVQAIVEENLPLARTVITLKNVGNMVVFILVWRGMRCPLKSASSGSM